MSDVVPGKNFCIYETACDVVLNDNQLVMGAFRQRWDGEKYIQEAVTAHINWKGIIEDTDVKEIEKAL